MSVMKKFVLILVFLILLVVLWVIENNANNINQRTYVSHIIIDIRWETKPEELGKAYGLNEEGENMPPEKSLAFAIAPYGDIYLVDRINHKILRFSPEGEFMYVIDTIEPDIFNGMCVDKENNIYISYGHLPEDTNRVYVKKYNLRGEHIYTYQLLKSDEISICLDDETISLYTDNSGNLYAHYNPFQIRLGTIFKFGTTDNKELSLEAQTNTCIEGGIGGNGLTGNRFYTQIWWPPEEEGILITDSVGQKIKTFKTYPGELIGVDIKNNLYFYLDALVDEKGEILPFWMLSEGRKGTHVAFFSIYDEKETLISSFHWKPPEGYNTPIYPNKINVDQGNIYILTISETGIKITKWSPVESGK